MLLSVFKAFLLYSLLCVYIPMLQLSAQTTTVPAVSNELVSKEQWHEDLRFLAAELPRRHAAAFHFLSKAAFVQEVSQLDRRLDDLNRDEIFVGMDRIENSIGDGHTYIRVPADAPIFPVHFERFGEDYRLVSTRDIPGARDALGGRLLKIDDMQIKRAQELLLTLTPADETQALRDVRATSLLNDGMVLHGLGITTDRATARYVVLTDAGNEVTLEYHGEANQFSGASITEILETGWLHAVAHPALYLQQPDQDFWCTYLPASQTGYCNFRSYKDLKHTARALTDLMQHDHPDNLVIDLRLNAGGDFEQGLKYVVNPIRRMSRINRSGHLFVLIGPRTFSAAMANAAHFRRRTNAILVGQTIGEKPNSYQEAREIVLPNSRWVARYSVRFYRFVGGDENLIRPDREIAETWVDFQAGRDPVMDWVLRTTSLSQKGDSAKH
jgi:Peptidase family S41